MKTRPILFNGEMVRAILAGHKTQTRRAVKEIQALGLPNFWCCDLEHVNKMTGDYTKYCPYGQVGDRLWVRETWFDNLALRSPADKNEGVVYRADGTPCWEGEESLICWRPSIFMPRWASRITLEITGVRVERLQDISDEDSLAEGVYPTATGLYPGSPKVAYQKLWESINGADSWASNPWVWVVEFKRVEQA